MCIRDRTITITAEERSELKKGIATAQSFDTVRWKDTIVCAYLLSIIDRIPDGVADLIIIDPPYNLSKDFNGLAFSAIHRRNMPIICVRGSIRYATS